MKRLASAAVLLLTAAAPVHAQAPPPDARQILDRAAAYVRRFVNDFSNVVAEEDFRQDWQSGERRRLTSDFLLVRYPGADGTWLAFRDVTAVNGRPVRDQQERLAKLFLEPFSDAVRRAEEISREASRHSLVEFGSISSPFAVLAWLQPFYQPQFTYSLGGVETIAGARMRALEFAQIPPPQLNPALPRVAPARGVAWVDERTGRVVKTEVAVGLAPNAATATATFRRDETLGIDVPAELRESRLRTNAGRRFGVFLDEFTGIAAYGRFRRFAVRTEEAIEGPPAVTPR